MRRNIARYVGIVVIMIGFCLMAGCASDSDGERQRVGWVVGSSVDGHGVIFHTVNGGKTWTRQGDPTTVPDSHLEGLKAIDEFNAWAVGAKIDGKRFREMAQRIQGEWLTSLTDPEKFAQLRPRIFQPKNKTDLEAVLAVSIIGPIGIPQEEAVYPQVSTADGGQMNAMNDYVIRMTKDEFPPAGAFWSLTLYDLGQGFFIPNERKKYSVGENAGMKLNKDGGIEIYIAAEKPKDVPEENWLPIERKDLDLSPQLRLYVPDLEKMNTWTPPKAEKLGS